MTADRPGREGERDMLRNFFGTRHREGDGEVSERCTVAFTTRWGDRRCDLTAGHDGVHVRNDGCGRPEYFWRGGHEIASPEAPSSPSSQVPDEVRGESLARRFHEAYERLAPQFGYETRRDSAVPWEQVPEQNRRLMIAVCAELLDDQP